MSDVLTQSSQRSDNFALIRRLIQENARDYVWRYALAFVFLFLTAFATGASAWIVRDIMNKVFTEKDGSMIWIIATAVIVIYAVKGFSSYASDVILAKIGNNIVARNQKRMYRHILKQGPDFFESNNIGLLSTCLTFAAQAARGVLDLLITSVGRDIATAVSLVSVMFIQDPTLAALSFLVLPPAVIGITVLVKRVRKIMTKEVQSIANILTTVQETVLGLRIVKAFRMEAAMTRRMDRAVEAVERMSNKMTIINARASPLMETLGGFAIAIIVMYGGYSVVYLGRDSGSLFSFLAALLMAYEPLKRLAKFNIQLESGMVNVRMLYGILDRVPTIQQAPDARPLQVTSGAVELNHLTFGYNQTPVISDMSVVFPAGKLSALVGPSGAGKSTIFGLIERFFDPQTGQVLIDGQELRGLTIDSFRDAIALVTQDTILFQGTIRENILYGRPDAPEEDVIAAAKGANAHEFITEFDMGYDSLVGEGGGRLSGGQRQRVAIARAMLRDAPILLLDEATSSLDSASEFAVQQALSRLMQGRTTIVIAHRLSTVRNADVIHVIDKGKLVQSGTHEQLLKAGGLYLNLYEIQFKTSEAA